ncbi:hypothetical protein MAR_010168, partial [Mya arenaria]
MDISDDAFSRTFSISTEEDPLTMDRSLFLGQGKTKLRASQSMPLMHKYWHRDAVTDETLHCLIQRLETMKSEVGKLEFPVTSSVGSACSLAVRSADSSSGSSIGNNFGNVKKNVLNFHQQAIDNNNELSDNVREDVRPIDTGCGRRGLSYDVVPPTPSAILRAAGLTRQFLVTKSSGESSSDKTDSVEKRTISLDSGASDPTFFKANYEHSPSVVIPKAKVDKMTQVSAAEITSATGWDMIEKVYILLQRLTFSSNTDIGRTKSLDDKVGSDNSSSKHKSIRIMNVSDVSENVRLENTTTAHSSTRDERKGLQIASWHDSPGSLDNVNAWFEKNRQLMHTLRTPPRQATVETIDSGFDDNTAPFSRRGRLSLPSLRTASGHTRLYRQSYKGPKYPFEPSLVNSGSSQSISVERGELGNEADDELIRGQDSLGKLPARQMRRRHRRINREDSFSFSDSELHERRKRMKRRTYTFHHSVSRVTDSSSDIEQQRQHFREIFLSPTKNAIPSFSFMSSTEDMFGWNSAMEKT